MGCLFAPAAQEEAPPQSGTAITSITFGSTITTEAAGSDNHPLCWAEDGHQYSSWGDGSGTGGDNSETRVSLGFARIEGDYPGFTYVNVWGGNDPENAATFGGKVESMLCIGGNLYALRSPDNNDSGWDFKEVWKSTTKGASWALIEGSRLDGDAAGEPGLAFYIDYGQDYGDNTDGKVYIFSVRIADPDIWNVAAPGVMWLARADVASDAFTLVANWEWLTGYDGSGNPEWGAMADRVAVEGLEDSDGYMRGSCAYFEPLDRYLLVQNHTATTGGHIVIYESPKPWGPWTQVLKESGWSIDSVVKDFRFGCFSPKWRTTVAGGVDAVFQWFRPDQWNSVVAQIRTT